MDFIFPKRPLRAAPLLGLLWLSGCSSFVVPGETTASVPSSAAATALTVDATIPDITPIDPNDDLSLGKRHFAETNYGLAEQHFRRAAEKATGATTRDAEVWLGLAASYDRLRRFDLADRAYAQAIRAVGRRAEVLNNQGYSFLLRRDYRRARATLTKAYAMDQSNAFIRNNLALLDEKEGRSRRLR